MKKASILLSFVLCFTIQVVASLNDGLIARYTFEGNANDVSGQHLDGTLVNSPSFQQGKSGQAISFDGINDYVNCGNDDQFNILGELTISAWIKPTQSGKDQALVNKCVYNGANNSPFDFSITPTRHLSIVRSDSSGHDYFYSKNMISLDIWSHVAVTVDSTGKGILYINGQNVGSDYLSLTPTSNIKPLMIGAREDSLTGGSDGTLFYKGLMDEVRIYDRALTSQEIATLSSIPEPATLSLLALGFAAVRLKRK